MHHQGETGNLRHSNPGIALEKPPARFSPALLSTRFQKHRRKNVPPPVAEKLRHASVDFRKKGSPVRGLSSTDRGPAGIAARKIKEFVNGRAFRSLAPRPGSFIMKWTQERSAKARRKLLVALPFLANARTASTRFFPFAKPFSQKKNAGYLGMSGVPFAFWASEKRPPPRATTLFPQMMDAALFRRQFFKRPLENIPGMFGFCLGNQ